MVRNSNCNFSLLINAMLISLAKLVPPPGLGLGYDEVIYSVMLTLYAKMKRVTSRQRLGDETQLGSQLGSLLEVFVLQRMTQ